MNKFFFCVAVSLFFALATQAQSEAPGKDRDLANIFKNKKINGTIVISSLEGDKTFCHNEDRARSRFLPASTFKIPNTLIALEEGAVADEKEIIKWDGKNREVPSWNKDQSMETAFPSSCVWFYQELAKRVGKDKYESYLKKIKYGNEQAGPEITTFWLNGDLRISVFEQIDFLKKVYAREYPFKASSYEMLKKLMIVEQTPSYTIRAKTGWTQKIGWFTGYVESGGKIWFFATNIEINNPKDLPLRQEITIEALRLKGII